MATYARGKYYTMSHEDLVHTCASELLDGMVGPTVSLIRLWDTALKQYAPRNDRFARVFYTRAIGACALYGETGVLPEHLSWDSKSCGSPEEKVVRAALEHLIGEDGVSLEMFRILGKSIYKGGFRSNVSDVTSANQKGRTIWDLSGKRVYSSREGGDFVRDVLLAECALVLSDTAPETVALKRKEMLTARDELRAKRYHKVRARVKAKQDTPPVLPISIADVLNLKRPSSALESEDGPDNGKKPKETPEETPVPFTQKLFNFLELVRA